MRIARVVLVGFMGAGKTTVGAELAARLGWPLVDLDEEVAARAGRPVRELFRDEGEAAFRERERAAAARVARRERVVVAAGGGAFAEPDTRILLQEGALTVWLRAGADVILSRIALDGSRPLATNRERIVRLLAEREPAYRLADLTVDATRSPGEVAEVIARALDAATAAAEER